MAEKSLQDFANEAKRTADAERGRKEFYTPPAGRQANLRILEWPGHVPCWIQSYVHYLETSEGKRVLTCGDENCYTCSRLHEMTSSQNKADMEFVRQSSRKMKVIMYVLDWDNLSAGPQLWEPKNTQNCNTWATLLSLFLSEEWGDRVYKFNQGVLIALNIVKEMRKMRSGQMEMSIQKSLVPMPTQRPLPYKRDAQGNHLIQVSLPNGNKQIFKLPELSEAITVYDEDYHRQCWGDEPSAADAFGGSSAAVFDEVETAGGGSEEAGAGDDAFATVGDSDWGAPPTPVSADVFSDSGAAAQSTKAPAPPTRTQAQAPVRRPARPQPARGKSIPARGRPSPKKR